MDSCEIGIAMQNITVFLSHFDKSDEVIWNVFHCSETDDLLGLYLDKIVFAKDGDLISARKFEFALKVCSWNKTTKEFDGYDMFCDAIKYFNTRSSMADPKYQSCHKELWERTKPYRRGDAVSDFICRYVYLKNKNLYRVANDQMMSTPEYIAGYLLDLDFVEALCLQLAPEDVFLQLRDNKIDVKSGKKLKQALGLPMDVVATLKELNMGKKLNDVQSWVVNGLATVNEVKDFLAFIKALIAVSNKRGLGAVKFDVHFLTSVFSECSQLLNFGVSLNSISTSIARELLMFRDILQIGKDVPMLVRSLRDIYTMLGNEGKVNPQQNIRKWHYIASRNQKIKEKSRADEYVVAAQKINRMSSTVNGYLIKCPETERELINLGVEYNNCLPTYRDRIIDDGAMIFSMYRLNQDGSIVEETPRVTFEVSKMYDIIQIKTFNDADVTDPDIIAVIQQWRTLAKKTLGNLTKEEVL